VHTFSVGITSREHDSDLGGVHHFLDRRIVAFGHRRAVGRSGFLDDRLPRAALVLSAILGAMFQRHSLIAGAVVMFAQLPVVVASAGTSPLLTAGGHLCRAAFHSCNDAFLVVQRLRRWCIG
jgi:hypothetical protein